eukprot:scaffold7849_cov457-Prasinococcus_capsulatus_cf.AAC.11
MPSPGWLPSSPAVIRLAQGDEGSSDLLDVGSSTWPAAVPEASKCTTIGADAWVELSRVVAPWPQAASLDRDRHLHSLFLRGAATHAGVSTTTMTLRCSPESTWTHERVLSSPCIRHVPRHERSVAYPSR